MITNNITYDYSVSVFIASQGTPSPVQGSTAGHMWIGLEDYTNGYQVDYYGFQSGNHRATGPGAIVTNDNTVYKWSSYTIKYPLTRDQYLAINEFVYQTQTNIDSDGNTFGGYNGFTNSCVDFVFASLRAAGIGAERSLITQDGRIIPMKNISGLEQIHQRFLNNQGYTGETIYWTHGTGGADEWVLGPTGRSPDSETKDMVHNPNNRMTDGRINQTDKSIATQVIQGTTIWRTVEELQNNNYREYMAVKDMLKPALPQDQIMELAQHDYTKGESTKLKEKSKVLDDELARINAYRDCIKEMGQDLGICKYLPDFAIRRIDQLKLGDVYHYEEETAKLQERCKDYNQKNGEYNAKVFAMQKELNTPEAQDFIAQRVKDYTTKEQERLVKRPELEARLAQLQRTDAAIREFGEALPYSVRDNYFKIKGNPRDPHNLLAQTGQIKIQAETMVQQPQQKHSLAAGVGRGR